MIQDQIPEALEKRSDQLARKYAESYSEEIRPQLEELGRLIAEMKKTTNLSINSINWTQALPISMYYCSIS